MNIDRYIRLATDFFTDKPLVAVIIVGAILLFYIKKTKEAIKVTIFLLFLAVGFYVFSELGSVSFQGLQNKSTGTVKSEKALEE